MTERPLSTSPSADEVFTEVRANIAFEHMIVAVLIASAACGALSLVVGLGAAAFHGFGFAAALSAAYDAFAFACLSFLIGFFTAVVAGLPLFLALEKAKLRKVWPYVLVALFVEIIVVIVLAGGAPMANDLFTDGRWLVFLPGVAAAILFGRRMRPVWRAAARAETAPTIYRIH